MGMKCYVLAGLLLLAGPVAADNDSITEWQAATEVQKNYCLAEVCLGMSLAEVERIPGATVKSWTSSKWNRNCTGTYAEWSTVDFVAKDGTKFIVGFRDFPGVQEPKDRFRVQEIALYLETTRSEFDTLTGDLVERWGLSPNGLDESGGQNWSLSSTFFAVNLDASFKYIPRKSMIVLSAKSDRYPDWMRSQAACHDKNPVLPKL